MNNKFWASFFRKDLNLGNRWWHRLFLVIFFVSFAWVSYGIIYNDSHIPQWKVVDSVDERLTSEFNQIRDLKKIDEKVEEKDRSYTLNLGEESLYDDFYCSNNLSNKIPQIQIHSGITNLYLNRKSVPTEVFVNYVRDNNIKCLIPDAYTYVDGTRITFLEPVTSNSIYGQNLVFYQKSNSLTAFYITKVVLSVVAVFIGIVIIYYKVFIYVVFGSKSSLSKPSQKS